MIAFFGHVAILLALFLALGGALLSFVGARYPQATVWGVRAVFAVLGLVGVAVGLMEYALITHDFSVSFVADVGGVNIPLYFTMSSLWAALEGSILYWALVLSGYSAAFLLFTRRRFLDIRPLVTGVLLGISSFFLYVIAGPGDPFRPVNPAIACLTACQGPPPLLLNHWMMGVHPQLLYLGLVGLSVPFAITVGALLHGTPSPEVWRLLRRWTLIPWMFLSVGIVAGMWWSYAVLGWGGYWSWDPVENISLMPWLAATAFLHSLQVQERRQMLKTWTLSLIMGAFLLTILGTSLTRSSILKSVHSFTQSTVAPSFVKFLAVLLICSIILLVWRSRDLASPGILDSAVCRETVFLFNNLLLVAITFTVLLGTLFPLIAEAAQGTSLTVGPPYYNQIAVPIAYALLFLMGVGPALPWGAARLEDLQYRLLGPVLTGVGVILLLLLAGVRGIDALVTFGTAAFVLTVTLNRVITDARARRANTGEHSLTAGHRLLRANPRRYGGYLAHIGVLFVIIGIAASQSYQQRATATLRPGQSVALDGYTVTYHGYRPIPQSYRMVIQGRVTAVRGGESLGTLYPSVNEYLSLPVTSPAVREEPLGLITGLLHGRSPLPDLGQLLHGNNPFEDVYVQLGKPPTHPNGPAPILLLINPMIGFIWLGGLITGIGGLFALMPARRRRRVAALETEPVRLRAEEVTV